jgi:hypothetical protein
MYVTLHYVRSVIRGQYLQALSQGFGLAGVRGFGVGAADDQRLQFGDACLESSVVGGRDPGCAQETVKPPSTTNSDPVIQREAGEAR